MMRPAPTLGSVPHPAIALFRSTHPGQTSHFNFRGADGFTDLSTQLLGKRESINIMSVLWCLFPLKEQCKLEMTCYSEKV